MKENHPPNNFPKSNTCSQFGGAPLFSTGQIVATPGALAFLKRRGMSASTILQRHVRGDWGELGRDDCKANDEAVQSGGRILSSYLLKGGKIWVITEATGDDGLNRAGTCLLLPSEY